MKVTILLGSIRTGRQSPKAGFYLQRLLEERNIETTMIDLLESPLPLLRSKTDYENNLKIKVNEISTRLHEADSLLLVTPEYHGSFSGIIKNATDYFWEEFHKKPVGVVTASAGKMAGINASSQLQHVILSMGGYALPRKFLVSDIQNAFDANNQPLNESLITNANLFLDDFIWFTEAIVAQKLKAKSTMIKNNQSIETK